MAMDLKVKEGHQEAFQASFLSAAKVARGVLGWKGQARLWDDLGLMHHAGIPVRGNRRNRLKQIKRILKSAFLQGLAEHLEPAP